VIALVDAVSPLRVWRVWHMWSLPYYLINVAMVVLIASLAPASVLLVMALAIPLLLGPFVAYQWLVRRAAPAVVAQVS